MARLRRVQSPLLRPAEHGRLQPAEAEVQRVFDIRTGEPVRPPRGGLRDPLDGRAAGKAEAENAGGLVEGLAGGVIPGPANEGKPAVAFHHYEVGVSPGSDEADQREARGLLGVDVLQPGGVDVTLEMVYADERQVFGQGQPLSGVDADQKRAGQAGAMGYGDAVELPELESGLVQRLPDNGHNG